MSNEDVESDADPPGATEDTEEVVSDGEATAEEDEATGEDAAVASSANDESKPVTEDEDGGAGADQSEEDADRQAADASAPTGATPEEDGEADPEATERIRALEAELAEREAELEDVTDRLKRVQADFQNYKKRMKRQQEAIRERATEELVERLLDVRDNLKRALSAESEDVEDIREGVKMTLAEMDRVLDAEGVSGIEPDPGDEVDPNRHEVMLRIDGDRPAGTIQEVYTPGYEMGSKILRPAQVTVSNGANDDGETSSKATAEQDGETHESTDDSTAPAGEEGAAE